MRICPHCRLLLRLTQDEHWEGVRGNNPNFYISVFPQCLNMCHWKFILCDYYSCLCVCVCARVCLYHCSCLSVVWGNTHTRSHTSSYSLRGLAAYYESLVGEWRENKRPTTLKWQHRAQTGRFTSLIPAHKDLKELSMWLRETTSIIL